METKKTLETLEEGFVECSRMPKEANADLLCNLNEKCTSDSNSGLSDVSHVEFDGELGNQRIRESSIDAGIGGKDQIDNGTVGSHGSEIKNNDVPVWEENLKSGANGGIQVGKVKELQEECDNCPEPGPPTTIEVAGNDINLFVEVFGPLDGMSEINNNPSDKEEHVSGDGDSHKECSSEINGVLSSCVKSKSAKNGEDGDGDQEYTFGLNDLVWAKTRSQLWWPGIISEPSNAASDATKSEKQSSFLVKLIGNANFVWCNNSELKPFIEYFDQMSRQINSRNFVGSVEKALCVIGQRVKLKLTCQCFSKESQTLAGLLPLKRMESSSVLLDDKHKYDALLFSQSQPARFVARIKHLAKSVHAPGKVELTVMKNQLSAFYCSIGHHELPLELLRSSSDVPQNVQDGLTPELMDKGHKKIPGRRKNSVKNRDDNPYVLRRGKRNCSDDADRVHDDKITSSSKISESRERKKSKYLSYPYVDGNRRLSAKSTVEKEAEDPARHSSISTKSMSRGRGNGMTSRKGGPRKPSKGQDVVCAADNIDASSAELLAELCSTACDCFYINRSKYSDSLKIFYISFRNFAFLDADKASKVSSPPLEPDSEKYDPQISNEAKVQTEGIKEVNASKKQRVNQQSVKKTEGKVVNDQVSETKTNDLKAKGKEGYKRAKKKEQVISASQQSISDCVGAEKKVNPNGSCVISFQQVPLDVPVNGKAPEKGEGCAQLSTSSCIGTDKKDNPDNSRVISFQQCLLDGPEHVKSAEESGGHAQQSTNNCVGTSKNDNPNSSGVISFQQTSSDVLRSGTSSDQTKGLNLVLPQTNTAAQLPDLNGNHSNESAEQVPSVGTTADLSKPVTQQVSEGLISPNVSGVQLMAFIPFPSKGTPTTFPQNILKFHVPVNGTNLCQNAEFSARVVDPNVTNTRVISFVQSPLPMGPFPSVSKSEGKERKRKQKAQQATSVIPDLNGNVLDSSLSGKTLPEGIPIPPDGMPPLKRGKNKSTNAELGSNGKSNEDLGGSLLLNFASGSNLPSKETLVAKFSRFGLLKESEIQVLNDSSVQIVYERSSDAKFAFRSLEKSNPFGEALPSFKLHCTAAALKTSAKRSNFKMPKPFSPVDPHKNQVKLWETPDIAVMRQNVEKMKLTLEKAGNNLSPEMRAKLENEIKAFLDKISAMGGSSSS